jgi:3-oxoacyl-[acyl-carrier-protein] synthase II
MAGRGVVVKEVWIVAAGAVTAAGGDLETTWRTLLAGETAIRRVDRFPTQGYRSEWGALVPDLIPQGRRSLVQTLMDRVLDQVAVAVPEETLLITATTKAGIDNLERRRKGEEADPEDILPAHLGRRAAERLGLLREPFNLSAACASSTVAVAQGASLIGAGWAEAVLILGLDVVTEFVFSGFSALQILSPFPCRPFDRDRAGLTVGEGGAYLFLMEGRKAAKGGFAPLAKVIGCGVSNDARHITAPDREGRGLIRAVEGALQSAGVKKEEVAGISAHGTGTIHNDAMELTAFRQVFGEKGPPLYSAKGCIGHTFGAAGGIEIALATKILASGLLPPTQGFLNPEKGAEGKVSAQAREIHGPYVLVTNSGFGGINAAVLLQRV